MPRSGRAGTANGPAIRNVGAAAADFMLRTGRMPLAAPNEPVRAGPAGLQRAEIKALVAYVASLGPRAAASRTSRSTTRADIAAGRAAYIATCAACHGAGASGDAVGGGAVAPPLLTRAPTQVGEAIRTGPGAMPAFDPHRSPTTQLAEIAAYLQFLRDRPRRAARPVGGSGPVAEGYVGWIVYGVGLLVRSPAGSSGGGTG